MKQTTRNQVPITTQKEFYFVLPPLTEQRKIAEILSASEAKIAIEKAEKMRLERIKQGLMDLLLTGKVRIKVD
jgi:type I restriction enzyme S subunit